MKKVLYPGSFDPITKGHMDIIKQANNLFDEVLIAVLGNSSKNSNMFTGEERKKIIEELYKDNPNIKVITSDKATVDVAKENNCKAIVRGLRSLTDFDYEIQMSQINKDISDSNITTLCLFADLKYQFISSSIVKELFLLNKDIKNYVDPIVLNAMINKNK